MNEREKSGRQAYRGVDAEALIELLHVQRQPWVLFFVVASWYLYT
jgi:hypothetical protein